MSVDVFEVLVMLTSGCDGMVTWANKAARYPPVRMHYLQAA